MKPELEETLLKECPLVFKDMHVDQCLTPISWGIYCGDGWFDLIYEASRDIEAQIRKMPLHEQTEYYALQIKEKFGKLRYYMSRTTDEISTIIRKAEEKSAKICEVCGKYGRLGKKGYWVRTCCGYECGGKNWEPIEEDEGDES